MDEREAIARAAVHEVLEVMHRNRVTMSYTTDDDGIHVEVGGDEVMVAWLDEGERVDEALALVMGARMMGRREVRVSAALMSEVLRRGWGAFEPTEKVPDDMEVVGARWDGERDVLVIVLASSAWPAGKVEPWLPTFKVRREG